MEGSLDWVRFALDLRMESRPGQAFNYCNPPVHLLSAILQQQTGMEARTYANQRLFAPLGIPEVTAAEWGSDPQGVTFGGIGLHLTPEELARFGLLILQGGRWDGAQVVPAGWVADSLTEHTALTAADNETYGGHDRAYGYLWSILPNEGYYAAFGWRGQHLYVLPEQNMVVVITAGLDNGQDRLLVDMINDILIPAAASGEALPANPEAAGTLAARIQEAAEPRRPVPPQPALAAELAGLAYALDPNPFGWRELLLRFDEGADSAAVTLDGIELQVGLDNVYRTTAVPGGGALALKGAWEDERSFLLTQATPGEIMKNVYRLRFEGDGLILTLLDPFTGADQFTMQGRQTGG
jgi:hypothetical protein